MRNICSEIGSPICAECFIGMSKGSRIKRGKGVGNGEGQREWGGAKGMVGEEAKEESKKNPISPHLVTFIPSSSLPVVCEEELCYKHSNSFCVLNLTPIAFFGNSYTFKTDPDI